MSINPCLSHHLQTQYVVQDGEGGDSRRRLVETQSQILAGPRLFFLFFG